MDIKHKAAALIRRHHTDDPIRLAKALGIQIVYGDLGGICCGNYLKYKRAKFIVLDRDQTPADLLPFVAAHELGHAICTPDANTTWIRNYTMSVNADIVERTASTFAVELLLNDSYLHSNNDYSIYQLAAIRGIPEDMVQLKNFNHD